MEHMRVPGTYLGVNNISKAVIIRIRNLHLSNQIEILYMWLLFKYLSHGRVFLCGSLDIESLPNLIEIVQFLLFWPILFYHYYHFHFAFLTRPKPDFCFCFTLLIHLFNLLLFLSSCLLVWYKCIGVRHYQILLLWFIKHLNIFSWGRLKKKKKKNTNKQIKQNSGNTDLLYLIN